MSDSLVFHERPVVVMSGTRFINVDVILQYEDTPLLEVGKFVSAGYTTQLSVFHADGTDLARVKGSRVYPTEAGKKASVESIHEPNRTIIELENKPIFDMQRDAAGALNGWAELYARDGVFVRAIGDGNASALMKQSDDTLYISASPTGAKLILNRNTINGCNIAFRVMRDGTIQFNLLYGENGCKRARHAIGDDSARPVAL
ncbi:MAG: hypothetical protein SGJ20_05800 [Planctomycetota bacterium]|nr:hypothetical protein [Planctomycetota bacterium]